jgi:hypothetical protein
MTRTTRFAAIFGLSLLAVLSAPQAQAARIFGFDHVDLRNVQEAQAQAHRQKRAARPRHHHLRRPVRHIDAERMAYRGRVSPLLNVARGYLGRGNFTGYREAWCADAVRAWLRQSGHSIAGTDHRAISFARYGRPTSPHVGAIAVERHHVGIVAAVTRRGVILLSGNHGHRVALGAYPRRRIIAFRDPI